MLSGGGISAGEARIATETWNVVSTRGLCEAQGRGGTPDGLSLGLGGPGGARGNESWPVGGVTII